MLDTVIIGAGFAGLAAARALGDRGDHDFVVLEARDRVGGRVKPGRLGDITVDLGGMWMAPSQTRLASLAEGYGVRTYSTHLEGQAIFRFRGRERRGPRERLDNLLGLSGGLAYLRARRRLDRLIDEIDVDAPWQHPRAAELDAITFEQWLRENVRHPVLLSAFRTVCVSVFCASPDQISLLFFVYYLKSGRSLDTLISSDTGGAQNMLFHGGTHQIGLCMADQIGDRLRLESTVRSVAWRRDQVRVETDKGGWTARRAILAIPPTLLRGVSFTPELPKMKLAMHNRLFMGSAIKFWLLYHRPFWRDRGLNGMIVRDDVPTSPIMDVSPPGQDRGILVGFFDGDHALAHGDLSTTARRRIVLDVVGEHLGAEARLPLAYTDHDWTGETWSGGCYGAFAPPGVLSRYGPWLRAPIGPLHWAGTETSSQWAGYIEGAIRSGERAAAEVTGAVSAEMPAGLA